ncbi:MAG: HD domain-containing protein [Myxococcota bacterium]
MHRVRDPIHGFIDLSPVEAALVGTRAVQRLRRVKQLGLTHLVYPGAEHSRFVHSLGACHVAGLLGASLARAGWSGDIALVRVCALLHDLGHPPFSHAGERGVPHEHMTLALVRSGEVAEVLAAHGVDPAAVAATIAGTGDPVASTLVSGQLDADRMDYLLRDARMCGVRYGEYDLPRLVESVVPAPDGGLAVRGAGLHAVEGLLLARYSMFQQVYFHRTRRVLDLLLEDVLPDWPTDPEGFLDWDDGRAFELLRHDPRPAARAIWERRIPACVAELEVSADPTQRAEADAIAARLGEVLGAAPRVDSSARMVTFRPSGDIPILDTDGRVRSVFAASPVLRRMDPHVEVRRIYVDRALAERARAEVAAFRGQAVQLRLFKA